MSGGDNNNNSTLTCINMPFGNQYTFYYMALMAYSGGITFVSVSNEGVKSLLFITWLLMIAPVSYNSQDKYCSHIFMITIFPVLLALFGVCIGKIFIYITQSEIYSKKCWFFSCIPRCLSCCISEKNNEHLLDDSFHEMLTFSNPLKKQQEAGEEEEEKDEHKKDFMNSFVIIPNNTEDDSYKPTSSPLSATIGGGGGISKTGPYCNFKQVSIWTRYIITYGLMLGITILFFLDINIPEKIFFYPKYVILRYVVSVICYVFITFLYIGFKMKQETFMWIIVSITCISIQTSTFFFPFINNNNTWINGIFYLIIVAHGLLSVVGCWCLHFVFQSFITCCCCNTNWYTNSNDNMGLNNSKDKDKLI